MGGYGFDDLAALVGDEGMSEEQIFDPAPFRLDFKVFLSSKGVNEQAAQAICEIVFDGRSRLVAGYDLEQLLADWLQTLSVREGVNTALKSVLCGHIRGQRSIGDERVDGEVPEAVSVEPLTMKGALSRFLVNIGWSGDFDFLWRLLSAESNDFASFNLVELFDLLSQWCKSSEFGFGGDKVFVRKFKRRVGVGAVGLLKKEFKQNEKWGNELIKFLAERGSGLQRVMFAGEEGFENCLLELQKRVSSEELGLMPFVRRQVEDMIANVTTLNVSRSKTFTFIKGNEQYKRYKMGGGEVQWERGYEFTNLQYGRADSLVSALANEDVNFVKDGNGGITWTGKCNVSEGMGIASHVSIGVRSQNGQGVVKVSADVFVAILTGNKSRDVSVSLSTNDFDWARKWNSGCREDLVAELVQFGIPFEDVDRVS